MRTFIKVTAVIWSLAFVGGFITGKSAFATQPYNVEVQDHTKTDLIWNAIKEEKYMENEMEFFIHKMNHEIDREYLIF